MTPLAGATAQARALFAQRIISLQLAAGGAAARRTYHLLTRCLADIDAAADVATTTLLERRPQAVRTR
jgi:hypothetical protein